MNTIMAVTTTLSSKASKIQTFSLRTVAMCEPLRTTSRIRTSWLKTNCSNEKDWLESNQSSSQNWPSRWTYASRRSVRCYSARESSSFLTFTRMAACWSFRRKLLRSEKEKSTKKKSRNIYRLSKRVRLCSLNERLTASKTTNTKRKALACSMKMMKNLSSRSIKMSSF